jgi:hypothetical protein
LLKINMRVRFANQSTHRIEGIADDVEVLVRDSCAAAHFAILNTERDESIPIILGRPFLHTERASIYAGTNNVHFDIGGKIEELSFKTHRPLNMSRGRCSKKNQETTLGPRAPQYSWLGEYY